MLARSRPFLIFDADGVAPRDGIACGAFRLNPSQRLLVDHGGRPVTLRGRAFDVLALLLRNAGRIVARADMLDAVWGPLHVTDDNVTQAVGEVRRALGAGSGMAIRTVRGFGYVLEPTAPATGRDRAARPVLAVQPFAAEGGDGGLVADLVLELSRGDGFSVQAGAMGGADYVLSGSALRAGGRLRVTALLVAQPAATLLWGERYERDLAGIDALALRDDLVGRIVAAVRQRLAR